MAAVTSAKVTVTEIRQRRGVGHVGQESGGPCTMAAEEKIDGAPSLPSAVSPWAGV